MSSYSYKILLVGDAKVGKTTCAKRLCNRQCIEQYSPTLGVDVYCFSFQIDNGVTITLNIWDCAGNDKFKGLGGGYYIKADGAILMSDTPTFDFHSLQNKVNCVTGEIPFIWVGNKKRSDVQFDHSDIVEVDAKTGCNLRTPFISIGEQLYRQRVR